MMTHLVDCYLLEIHTEHTTFHLHKKSQILAIVEFAVVKGKKIFQSHIMTLNLVG